ncbi:hypothetical protein [Streptomyces tricolor]|uniref:hypothetical protein n=1 Tax=Streptomyces tricolor TaxID=68277 RepID=UPI0036E669B0
MGVDRAKTRAIAGELGACAERLEGAHSDPRKGRYACKEPHIFGDSVSSGSWTVDASAFRRYGKAGN